MRSPLAAPASSSALTPSQGAPGRPARGHAASCLVRPARAHPSPGPPLEISGGGRLSSSCPFSPPGRRAVSDAAHRRRRLGARHRRSSCSHRPVPRRAVLGPVDIGISGVVRAPMRCGRRCARCTRMAAASERSAGRGAVPRRVCSTIQAQQQRGSVCSELASRGRRRVSSLLVTVHLLPSAVGDAAALSARTRGRSTLFSSWMCWCRSCSSDRSACSSTRCVPHNAPSVR